MGGKTISAPLNSEFQLFSPFLTSMPYFIKIEKKLAKLVGWIWPGWLGGLVGGKSKSAPSNPGFKLSSPLLTTMPNFFKMRTKLAKLAFKVILARVEGWWWWCAC